MLCAAVAIHRPRNFSVDLSFLIVHIHIGHLDALEADRAWTNAYFCQHYAFWFGELPPCCILNHFDAFWLIVFAWSLRQRAWIKTESDSERERGRDSTAEGLWRGLHRRTAESTYYNPLEIDYEAMSSTTTTTTTTTTTSTTGTAITLIQLTTCEAIKMLGRCLQIPLQSLIKIIYLCSLAWSCACCAQQPSWKLWAMRDKSSKDFKRCQGMKLAVFCSLSACFHSRSSIMSWLCRRWKCSQYLTNMAATWHDELRKY